MGSKKCVSTPNWVTRTSGLNFLTTGEMISEKAAKKISSFEKGLNGILILNPSPFPTPFSERNPVPGKRNSPDSWIDIVKTWSES